MANQKKTPRQQSPASIALYALLLLIFLQLLTDLIESTYTFGLLGVKIPPEIVFVLFLLTPVLLIFFPRALERPGFALITGELALLCRAISLVLDTRGKMIFTGLGVGAFLLFLPALLWQNRKEDRVMAMGSGLAFASLTSMLLRSLNYGTDPSAAGLYVFTGWGALILFAGLALAEWYRSVLEKPVQPTLNEIAAENNQTNPAGFAHAAALSLGLMSALVLVYFGFNSPTVVARWSGGSYTAITALMTASAAIFAGLWSGPRELRALFSRGVLIAWNGLFVLALALALFLYSYSFPSDPAAYPLSIPNPGLPAWIALVAALVLHPVIYANFAFLGQALARRVTAPRRLASGIALAAFWLLLITSAHVFTTVYDYIPVVGPFFRDRLWLVYTTAGLAMGLPVLLLRKADIAPAAAGRERWVTALTAALMAIVTIVLAASLSARPARADVKDVLRVLTFNIQQGYTQKGQRGLDEQLKFIREVNPDILGLQETDTARIAGGNADAVRYFTDQLGMYSYYGPSTVTGTFGIALLSRYPIEDPRTFFMYSKGEQTAAILATIRVGDRPFRVLVTHLGNKGPIIQQEQVLSQLAGETNIIAMGDFNFRPDTEQYALTIRSLSDAWLLAEETQVDQPELNADRRIDQVFVSPGTRVLRANYYGPGPSDHPALSVEIGW